MAGIRVDVSGQEVFLHQLSAAPAATVAAMERASVKAQALISNILRDVFTEAADAAGEGFPDIYLEHLLGIISEKKPLITGGGGTFEVLFDLESLGSYEDFSEGFHYRAILEGTGKEELSLPYTGQPLKYNQEERLAYWTRRYDDIKDETYTNRVAYWDTKGVAPQWLLLQYGQTESFPTVHPFPIIETITEQSGAIFGSIVEQEMDRALQSTFRENYHVTREYYRDARGRFAKRG